MRNGAKVCSNQRSHCLTLIYAGSFSTRYVRGVRCLRKSCDLFTRLQRALPMVNSTLPQGMCDMHRWGLL
jgi:hypothetical protein